MAQLAARRSHNPKVASSILAGSILDFPDSLVGQDRRLSPARPGFNSRSGNFGKRKKILEKNNKIKNNFLIGEGFEPSPPKRLVP